MPILNGRMLTSCYRSHLQRLFTFSDQFWPTHGLPRVIVMDNGSSFTSKEFKTFVRKNGIKHMTFAPYHPSTKGQVETTVQTLKRCLKCILGNSVQERLTRFLFDYRITPHTTTSVPSCKMLMNRRLRSRLDVFHPDVSGKVESRQVKQKELCDQRSLRQFTENDQVYICAWILPRESQTGFLEQLFRSLVHYHTGSSCRME